MNLTNFTIHDIYGVARIQLEGEYTDKSLSEKLIEEWIPYFECHKCGRWDYCKYVQQSPWNPHRAKDIKCGVASDCIRNLIQSVFSEMQHMTQEQVQDFLDGAYYFYKFIYDAEQYTGMNMNSEFHQYYGELAPYIYSHVGYLRNDLNNMALRWKDIPNFKTKSPVLFVEGYGEKAFLDEMRKSHMSWFMDLNVEVYAGKGNRRSKRIQMLLEKYKEQGLIIYAQGDADGEYADVFRGLINSGSIEQDKIFVFEHDFETSLPVGLLLEALVEMQFLEPMPIEEFREKLGAPIGSVISRLHKAFNVDISSSKIEFATTTAAILNGAIWWTDDFFMKQTELGRFLNFVQDVH
jgi:hypothetical protein